MAGFWNRTATVAATVARKAQSYFSGTSGVRAPRPTSAVDLAREVLEHHATLAPAARMEGGLDACGSAGQTIKAGYSMSQPFVSDALLGFFLRTGFIGHQIAALLSQHWLIDKACRLPARDASRKGFDIVADDGGEVDEKIVHQMRKADERFKLNDHLVDFVYKGRVFGIRVALFKVDSTDPNYYTYPFNPDAITPGSYRGIVQIDPSWIFPELDMASTSDPASLHFYQPTWWTISGKRYHRSHLVIYRNGDMPDILRPQYLYGGKPVPQLILERVYNAERTANEAPQLAMTKRTTTFATDTAEAFANLEQFTERMELWARTRDNFGIKVMDKEGDEMQQFDTSLSDLDAVIMTNYQLVAAASGVPATKLLGTSPKGFNATGEYEEANYHEELESIQTHDLTPLVERHHLCVMRSIIAPANDGTITPTSVVWKKLDAPTAKEEAEVQNVQAQRDKTLIDAGVLGPEQVLERLAKDRASGYHGIEVLRYEDVPTQGEPGVAAPGPVDATDAADPVRLVTNQTHLDENIVADKLLARDFAVQVSPLFVTEAGERYRIVIDGHHSLAAAQLAGVQPDLVEGDYTSSDYRIVESNAGA